MSFDPVVRLENLGKCYHVYEKPRDRLLQMLTRGRKKYAREFWALRDVSLAVKKGECLGVIGRNGAGKSTLMQLVCGTLNPTCGTLAVQGRVAALLELGAGFNPEFSGRENVLLSAAVNGLSQAEIATRYEEIVEFSGVRDFIDQPVKTYSSGMYVRLAFSIATSVDPDILVIDEALSVGDGEFARKSFDRILSLQKQGKTILFCSHSLYQVEKFCDRVLWLDHGRPIMLGGAGEVIPHYSAFLFGDTAQANPDSSVVELAQPVTPESSGIKGQARLTQVDVALNGLSGTKLKGDSGQSTLRIRVRFVSDPLFPSPVVGITFDYGSLLTVTSVLSSADQIRIQRDNLGVGEIEVVFPKLALRKGEYQVSVYLGCENALHIYDKALGVATIEMADESPILGIFTIEHQWLSHADGCAASKSNNDQATP